MLSLVAIYSVHFCARFFNLSQFHNIIIKLRLSIISEKHVIFVFAAVSSPLHNSIEKARQFYVSFLHFSSLTH